MRRALLTVAALYLGVLGVGFIVFPREAGTGAVPLDATPALIAYLRVLSGPFLGIALLNWLMRKGEASAAMQAVLAGNATGFGCVALMDVIGVTTGSARDAASGFMVIHLALMTAFLAVWQRDRRAPRAEGR